MDSFAQRFKIEASPVAHESRVIVRGNIRFTVLTPCLLRVDNQNHGTIRSELPRRRNGRSSDFPL